jgi:hypothetical protein
MIFAGAEREHQACSPTCGIPAGVFRCRPAVFALLAVLALLPTSLEALLGVRLSENVHVVVPGLAYRSAQLWPDELKLVIADYGIRSIISLVPPEPGQPWYQGELLVSSGHQIARYELSLSPGLRTDQRSVAAPACPDAGGSQADPHPFPIRG